MRKRTLKLGLYLLKKGGVCEHSHLDLPYDQHSSNLQRSTGARQAEQAFRK